MKLTALVLAIALIGNANAQETPAEESNALKVQVLLDRAHFAVGEIDGEVGSTTTSAIKFFQENRGLPVTGELDDATLTALDDGQPILKNHTLSSADVAGPFGGRPKYANKMEKLGELFQVSPEFLKTLNPDANFAAGESIKVPAVGGPLSREIAKIVVTTSTKSMMAYDADGNLVAYYPTTLGSEQSIPYGEHRVVAAIKNPHYKYKRKSMSGGPNNYVGSMWMALSERHYGIHGSPEPSKIAKQQSAGCIRLTNWDAHEVAAAIIKNVTVVVQK